MCNKRVLVLNLLAESALKYSFNNRISQVFTLNKVPYNTIHLNELHQAVDFHYYTHLLISGSTQSAMDELPWYADLDRIMSHFITAQKSILGVCFGHQFLIRYLVGKNHVRKSATPEIGWTQIIHTPNNIFSHLHHLKAAVYHYDEVFDLDDHFEVLAHSDRCAIHSFQVKGKNIWGIQFHPDFMYENVFEFAQTAKQKDPQFTENHCQTATSLTEFKQNDLIFKNWLALS